jgi:tryptophanyl-tRNA synthetase
MIADLHAFTSISEEIINYKENSKKIANILISCGIKCKIFIQSEISEHLFLSHILSSFVSVGSLSRMIQYKEKGKENSNSSILNYPILMCSDILMYNADLIIVGEDQKQHLELASDIFKKVIKRFPNIDLKIPFFYIDSKAGKIMDLINPLKKMSKSNKNSVYLLDDLNVIKKKVLSAKTDSIKEIYYDIDNRPGVSNLIKLYSLLKNNISIKKAENYFLNLNHYDLKNEIINHLVFLTRDIQEKFKKNSKNIDKFLEEGNDYIRRMASDKISKIKKTIQIK